MILNQEANLACQRIGPSGLVSNSDSILLVLWQASDKRISHLADAWAELWTTPTHAVALTSLGRQNCQTSIFTSSKPNDPTSISAMDFEAK